MGDDQFYRNHRAAERSIHLVRRSARTTESERPLMRRLGAEMRLGQIIKENAEDEIDREKLDAFDPVGFAVAADLKENVNGRHQGEDFGQGKFQIHRTPEQVGKKYE